MKNFFRRVQQTDQKILDRIWDKHHSPRLTVVMSFFSHPPYWRHLVFIIILTSLILGSFHTRLRIGLLLIAVTLSDQTCNLIKAFVKRIRPTGPYSTQGNFWKKLGHYSFPSSHSANNFCTAVLTLHWWHPLGIFFYFLAVAVAFSRVYLRNHYPSDVVIGGLIGIIYGILFILGGA
ncbi:MAG TPA: hypothetical protein DDW50_17720 [Firmicutes bacterium]|jgi:undecaprenyl-diphosphatase|nr:hypothetical protein [Bacillota bacterium]